MGAVKGWALVFVAGGKWLIVKEGVLRGFDAS